MADAQGLSRREFLKVGAVAAAVGVVAPSMLAAEEKAPALEYRTLGRTGLKVTTVSLGCMQAPEEVIDKAFDLGINFFDTAHVYKDGRNEQEVGRVLRGHREKVAVCTKIEPEETDVMLKKLETSLQRLRTDHVELLLMHGARKAAHVTGEEFLDALTLAKKQGKARFIGVSTHQNMPEVIHACIDAKVYDAVLTTYNWEASKELREAVARAKKEGVGILAMKTQRGNFKSPDGTLTPAQAALKWVLDDENVSCAIPGATKFEYLEQNVAVMGKRLGYFDRRRLERFAAATEGRYCTGCDECAGSCPQGVDIAAVRRCAMYLDGYGDGALARAQYGKLCAHAGACAECPSCTAQCRRGVALGPILREAHGRLA